MWKPGLAWLGLALPSLGPAVVALDYLIQAWACQLLRHSILAPCWKHLDSSALALPKPQHVFGDEFLPASREELALQPCFRSPLSILYSPVTGSCHLYLGFPMESILGVAL